MVNKWEVCDLCKLSETCQQNLDYECNITYTHFIYETLNKWFKHQKTLKY